MYNPKRKYRQFWPTNKGASMTIEIRQLVRYPSEYLDKELSEALSDGWTLSCPPVYIGKHDGKILGKDLFLNPKEHPRGGEYLTSVHDFLYVLQRQTP